MSVILFLDIDGVLRVDVPEGHSPLGRENREIDRQRVRALAKVLQRFPDVIVVVSSTWRHLEGLEDLKRRLAPLPVVGVTGPRVGSRYEDLAGHAYKRCTDWVALDDDARGWPEQERWRLVHCDPSSALGPRELDELEAKIRCIYERQAEGGKKLSFPAPIDGLAEKPGPLAGEPPDKDPRS